MPRGARNGPRLVAGSFITGVDALISVLLTSQFIVVRRCFAPRQCGFWISRQAGCSDFFDATPRVTTTARSRLAIKSSDPR